VVGGLTAFGGFRVLLVAARVLHAPSLMAASRKTVFISKCLSCVVLSGLYSDSVLCACINSIIGFAQYV